MADRPSLSLADKKRLWAGRISRGLNFRWTQTEKHWSEYTKLLLGDHWDPTLPEYSQVDFHSVVNITWHIIRSYLPSLYLDDPYALVQADPEPDEDPLSFQDKEKWFQAMINRNLRLINLKREIRQIIFDAIYNGYGIGKVGWFEVSQGTYDSMTGNIRIPNQSAYIKRCSPRNMVFDPDAGSFDDARWVAETWVRPYYDTLADDRYDGREDGQLCRRLIRPWLWSSDKPDEAQNRVEAGKVKMAVAGADNPDAILEREGYVRIWEIVSREEGGQLLTFSQTGDSNLNQDQNIVSPTNPGSTIGMEYLLREENLPYTYLNRFNYFVLSFNDIADHLYPPSDLEMIREQQKELNFMRSIEQGHVRKQKTLHLYDQTRLTPDDIGALADLPDGTFKGVEGMPEGMINSIQPPPLNPDIYQNVHQLISEIWETSGIDRTAMNQPMKGETATATVQRGNISGIRMSDREKLLKSFLENLIGAMADIMLTEDDKEKTYPVSVEENGGQVSRLEQKIGDFIYNYKIKLEVQNTFPLDRQIQLSQYLSAVNLTANNPNVDQRELAIRTYEMFNLRGIDKLVPSSMIPQELILLLQNSPQFMQLVMQAGQQYLQAMQAQQQGGQPGAGGAPPGPGGPAAPDQGRVMADVNQFQEGAQMANAGTASAIQGGANG